MAKRLRVSSKPKKTSLRKEADRLVGAAVRSRGICEMAGAGGVQCGGHLQWCHIISRGYHAVRWDERNAFCGCQAHHVYFTHRPLEFERFVREKIGDEMFDELRRIALTHVFPDVSEIVRRYRGRPS